MPSYVVPASVTFVVAAEAVDINLDAEDNVLPAWALPVVAELAAAERCFGLHMLAAEVGPVIQAAGGVVWVVKSVTIDVEIFPCSTEMDTSIEASPDRGWRYNGHILQSAAAGIDVRRICCTDNGERTNSGGARPYIFRESHNLSPLPA